MSARLDDPHLELIVEGPGDTEAIPVLVRKWLHEEGIFADAVAKPLASNGLGNLTKAGGIEKFLAVATSRPGCRAVVIVIDGDSACPVDVAATLRNRVGARVPVVLVVADKNFEDWIYASAETMGDYFPPFDARGSGKTAVRQALAPSAYVKPVDQPAFAAKIDDTLASSRSRSYKRFRAKMPEIALLLV